MADNGIYARLKKLFSTGTVVRRSSGGKLKVADTSNIQSFVNRRAIDRYHRFYSNQSGGYGSTQGRYETAAAFHGARLQLFRDYDMMDADPIIASVLDIYADESTIKDEFGKIIGIQSKNDEIQEILNNLFYDILNIEFNLWPWVRNMCKYGDFFLYLHIDPEYGVVNAIPLSIYETMRIEGKDPSKPFEVEFKIDTDFLSIGKTEFESYEIAHFRLLADTNFLPYGKAMIENGRRTWKQLQLMEDAMLIHRIIRAPDKRKIKIDIGNIPPNEVDAYIEKIITKMKRAPLIDQKTGDYNLRFSMMNIVEDFILPTRGKDTGTDIENLPGLAFNAIEDIEYLRQKMMAAFKVPKAFLGYEEDLSGKATLAAQDVRFARTIERIQRILVSELTKIAIVHLYVQGYRNADLINFELTMSSPSTIHELEKINIWKEKIGLAETISTSKFLSREWIYNNILELSDSEMKEEQEKIQKEVKMMAELQRIEQEAMNPQPEEDNEPATEEDQIAKDMTTPDETEEAPEEEPEAEPEAEEETPPVKESGAYTRPVGRPSKGYRVGHDKHYLGRDPLGDKENRKQFREIKELIKSLELVETKSFKQIIAEESTKTNTNE